MTQQSTKKKKNIGVIGATAIGIGGMMGAGLYTLVGLATASTGRWLPIAFIIGGFVAAFSVYSYSKLGEKYPSRGGAAQFLLSCFGNGLIAGGLNVFQYFGWIVAMALYAAGFAEYACDLTGLPQNSWISKCISVGIILVVVVINLLGSKQVARAQTIIVSLEILILLIFIAVGFTKAHVPVPAANQGSALGVISAAGLLYVTYEGFGVITNSAGSMSNPKKQLPRAMFLSLAIVVLIYVVTSIVVIATLGTRGAIANQGHALSAAGKVVLGPVGKYGIGIAALVATASAVNSTMFGDENLGMRIASVGEIPYQFGAVTKIGGPWGLFITAALTAIFVIAFPLSAVGEMASLSFLLVYASVNIGHLRVYKQTGAKPALLWIAIILNLILFVFLFGQTIMKGEVMTWLSVIVMLVLSFVLEWVWEKRNKILHK